mmetsp:Transcript_49385/g.145764  ORF Transcript_49385/g.145764 Transcript_49385/m.145764 type:complete len:204 (+) Transcript_49385:794-1405(+)
MARSATDTLSGGAWRTCCARTRGAWGCSGACCSGRWATLDRSTKRPRWRRRPRIACVHTATRPASRNASLSRSSTRACPFSSTSTSARPPRRRRRGPTSTSSTGSAPPSSPRGALSMACSRASPPTRGASSVAGSTFARWRAGSHSMPWKRRESRRRKTRRAPRCTSSPPCSASTLRPSRCAHGHASCCRGIGASPNLSDVQK